MLFIKVQQKHIYRGLMMDLNSSSTKAVSIENYEIQIFIYDFKHIHVYLCRVSFLRILDIYKNYFKVRKRWCNLMKSHCARKLWLETEFALIHNILSRSYCVFAPRVLWPKSFLIFIVRWTEELYSQHLPQVGMLVTYWDLCIIG